MRIFRRRRIGLWRPLSEASNEMRRILATFALITLIRSALAEDQPFPFHVDSQPNLIMGPLYQWLVVTISPDRDIAIRNIVVNRGNCGLYTPEVDPQNHVNPP